MRSGAELSAMAVATCFASGDFAWRSATTSAVERICVYIDAVLIAGRETVNAIARARAGVEQLAARALGDAGVLAELHILRAMAGLVGTGAAVA
jgi:hypothetical protein